MKIKNFPPKADQPLAEKFKIKNSDEGMTLIEIIIVLAIIIVITVISASATKNYRDNYALSVASEEIISALHSARSKTLASEGASQFGVHFAPDMVILFKGTSYDAGDPSNETAVLSSKISISAINLGGPVDVIFSRLTGVASASGSIVIILKSNPSKTETINILPSGIAYSQ